MATPVGTATAATSLHVRSLSKRFGDRVALQDVSFEVGAGELVAVVGPNGAGKTTLLSILAGIQSANSGDVDVPDGGVGWVPQQPAVYSKLTVAENLRLFANLERVPDPDAAVARMLEQADLTDRANDEVGTLSGGNRQRVNIAVGLVSQPAVLLLDEPSTALDPRQRERLWGFVGGQSEHGTSVLYSTHIVQEVELYADRVLVLADGELIYTGTPRELEERSGASGADFETAFVRFLEAAGH